MPDELYAMARPWRRPRRVWSVGGRRESGSGLIAVALRCALLLALRRVGGVPDRVERDEDPPQGEAVRDRQRVPLGDHDIRHHPDPLPVRPRARVDRPPGGDEGGDRGGEAEEVAGADALLPQIAATTIIADRGYDAEARVLTVRRAAGKTAIIPPKHRRKDQRDYDRDLYAARHLIEHFCCRLKQYRAIATRYDKTRRHFLAAIHLVASAILLN